MDSDDPIADAEIGQVGVAIDSLADMEEMFDGIPLDRVSTSMTINAPAAVLVAMYIVVAEKQGVPAGDIMGTAQNDVLKEYVARGTYIYPPRESLRLAADLITYCARYAPKFNTISVSGYHIRDAGSTAAQEIGFAFANAIAYIEACQRSRRRHRRRRAAHLVDLQHAQQLLRGDRQVPRAAAHVGAGCCASASARKTRTRGCCARTSRPAARRSRRSSRRTTSCARRSRRWHRCSAACSRSRSLATTKRSPSRRRRRSASRCARSRSSRTRRGVTDTVDPLGGSYYVEALTNEIEQAAQEYIDRVEDMGGSVAAIESGYMQTEIQEAAVAPAAGDRDRQARRRRRQPFPQRRGAGAGDLPREHRTRPRADRSVCSACERNATARPRQRRWSGCNEAARGDDNLMPAILDAVRAYATLGEICGELRKVWGEYRPPTVV